MRIVWRWRDAARRGERAFSLLEVVVALAILAMSILFITRVFLILLQQTNRGGNVTMASALAVRRLEQIRGAPESQSSDTGWILNFDAIIGEAPTPFPAPYSNYAYEVFINQVNTTPVSPSWLTGQPLHPNNIKWITVRVTHHGQALAQVTSSVIRNMYWRP
ncbi:MAG: type IV pilus modification PilV family protein [bacterium]